MRRSKASTSIWVYNHRASLPKKPKVKTLNEKLFKMLDILALINSTQDLEKLLQLILKEVRSVMNAEASSLMLLDPHTNELYFNTVEGGEQKKLKKFGLRPIKVSRVLWFKRESL